MASASRWVVRLNVHMMDDAHVDAWPCKGSTRVTVYSGVGLRIKLRQHCSKVRTLSINEYLVKLHMTGLDEMFITMIDTSSFHHMEGRSWPSSMRGFQLFLTWKNIPGGTFGGSIWTMTKYCDQYYTKCQENAKGPVHSQLALHHVVSLATLPAWVINFNCWHHKIECPISPCFCSTQQPME